MKKRADFFKKSRAGLVLFLFILGFAAPLGATDLHGLSNGAEYNEYKGKVVNSRTGDPVASAYLVVDNTNLSSVTNSDGEFSLKVPVDMLEATVTVSYLGYQSKSLPLSYFKESGTRIELDESVQELDEVALFTSTNAYSLVKKMLKKRGENYLNDQTLMTAFYRETIQKGRRNISLSEAVAEVYKQPNRSAKKDDVALIKARKSTDYKRLDTVALKLRGGPYNTLYIDVMKYPEFLFDENSLDNFKFSFNKPTRINDQYLYVVDFEEINRNLPWYYGKLFIDAESLTLVKATYSLNVDNRKAAGDIFVSKKPSGVKVYPVEVNYRVDYRKADGKWYYGYGNAQLEFVVNWKRKIFNSRYKVNSEMAVTDWKNTSEDKIKKDKSFIKPSVVMVDDVSGFADVDFWGSNNIIEPEKSIQNAIEKIQRKLEREED
ncbi:carboxypeptidase-like regulatory domain-containing protein [Salegentibacter chungangensis]|uniref:Carboxypeptidase-like regulatory domain-containing protein n=1 Tax=Salegentibacter chungangensis TaxID=1335724 RepID=A0ABW3NRI1_9FLAO